jgi:hypothetical protein
MGFDESSFAKFYYLTGAIFFLLASVIILQIILQPVIGD